MYSDTKENKNGAVVKLLDPIPKAIPKKTSEVDGKKRKLEDAEEEPSKKPKLMEDSNGVLLLDDDDDELVLLD